MKSNTPVRLGILGGGQLARMLALKCHCMGIEPYILASSRHEPASQVTSFFVKGRLSSKKDLRRFLQQVDLAVFENEFLDMTQLSQISKEVKTTVYPSPKVMQILQDRLTQKKLLKKYSIPTADFKTVSFSDPKKPGRLLQQLLSLFPKGVVLKKRNQGYDGYGTCILNPSVPASRDKALQFIKKNKNLIAEEFISFKKEMALILARNKQKQIIELPLVHTYQESAKCLWLKGPCRHKNKTVLLKKLKNMMESIDYIGVLAFELFDVSSRLLVNELAPRVHNSGHYSLSALSEDQFTLHIKAVLNYTLHTPYLLSRGFAMLNLLSHKNLKAQIKQLSQVKGADLYWYGKSEYRPGRKMGHINALAGTPKKALSLITKLSK